MSNHKYTSSGGLFDDVDDETFLQKSPHSFNSNSNLEAQKVFYAEKRREIENSTLQSTNRSISLLRDSEQVGIATAEELLKQREQLERTDKRLDEINQTLRFSQKHINGIKSVFSSLKNYISGRNDMGNPVAVSNSGNSQLSSAASPLQESIPEYDRYDNHPVVRLREQEAASLSGPPSGSKDFTAKLDANMQEMHSSILKLKGLATDMSLEIDSQNDLIGSITDKTENADITIARQNKEMQRVLKK